MNKNTEWEYIEHVENNKRIDFIKMIVFEFPDLLKDKRINFVMDTIFRWEDSLFNLRFTEAYYYGVFRELININLELYKK